MQMVNMRPVCDHMQYRNVKTGQILMIRSHNIKNNDIHAQCHSDISIPVFCDTSFNMIAVF